MKAIYSEKAKDKIISADDLKREILTSYSKLGREIEICELKTYYARVLIDGEKYLISCEEENKKLTCAAFLMLEKSDDKAQIINYYLES